MVLPVYDPVIDVQYNDAGFKPLPDVPGQVVNLWPGHIGAPGFYFVQQQLPHHAVELGQVAGSPECILIARVVPAVEEVQVAFVVAGQGHEQHLFGRPYVECSFKPELASRPFYGFGWFQFHLVENSLSILV